MVKNHCLAKSINDAYWYQFCVWDENAARNILSRGFGTVGQTETSRFNLGNACGEVISTDAGEILYQQIASMNQESQRLQP